jgi:hypothetical protein
MGTVGIKRLAAAAAVKNQPVGELRPIVLRDKFHQHRFDFFRINLAREAEAHRKPRDVRVDDHADILPKGIAENDVGGFATDAGKGDERVHGLGHFTGMLIDEKAAAGADIFRLGAIKADGTEVVLERGGIGFGVVARRRVFLEERGCDFVDLHVGTLRGEDGRDQELERIREIELAMGVRINARKDFAERLRAGGGVRFFHDYNLSMAPSTIPGVRTSGNTWGASWLFGE